MKHIIESLVKGDPDVQRYFAEADRLWEKILEETADDDVKALGNAIADETTTFISCCGGDDLGRSIMVCSGIGRLFRHSEGFGEEGRQLAENIIRALRVGPLGDQVQMRSDQISKLYGLGSK